MAATSPHKLSLIADHLKLSLLERRRAQALNLEASSQDNQIRQLLSQLHSGLEDIEAQHRDLDVPVDPDSEVSRLRKQYEDLYKQFHGQGPPSAETTRPNNKSLSVDFEAAQRRPASAVEHAGGRFSKSVRFRDNPDSAEQAYKDDVAAQDEANRTALLGEQGSYRDEPGYPDQSGMDNQQIHAYHKQVIQDQDEQLETLGQSVRRQRMLGIEMGNELDVQNEMLDDVERGVDRHSGTLDRARRRLGGVARRSKENWSWVTIGILIVILVLLIIVLK